MRSERDPHQPSKIRSFLFVGLATVWFSEMLFMGIPALSKIWAELWQVVIPDDSQLAAALSVSWSVAAPAKGALFVMAVIGLRSRNPATRTALFAAMSLVPPLNIAFPFRQQGFLVGPMMVASILSLILWGSFVLSRETTLRTEPRAPLPPSSPREKLQRTWFAINSIALTLLAGLFLFRSTTALGWILPGYADVVSTNASLIHTNMATGTHVLAVAVASWFATASCRTNPSLRNAVSIASTVHAGLFVVFPLWQIAAGFGTDTARRSMLAAFVPLFLGWVIYLFAAYRGESTHSARLVRERG